MPMVPVKSNSGLLDPITSPSLTVYEGARPADWSGSNSQADSAWGPTEHPQGTTFCEGVKKVSKNRLCTSAIHTHALGLHHR